jgi:hypothetical protein
MPDARRDDWKLARADRREPSRAWVAAAIGLACLWLIVASVAAWGGQVVTGDEVILLSASESLVERGRAGAPIFGGVYGAEDHQFLWPPLEHVLHWPVMRAFGVSLESARAVSLISGVTIIVGSGLLGFRAGGGVAAALTAWLLVLWRTGLVGTGWGIPLASVSRSIRYDVVVVALVVAGLVALERWLRTGGRGVAVALGAASAAALLTHWVGLVLPVAALVAWNLSERGRRPGVQSAAVVVTTMFMSILPWLLHVTVHLDDAVGQWTLVHGWRAEAAAGGVLSVLGNVVREPLRYRGLLEAGGPGAAAVGLAVVAAVWLRGPLRDRWTVLAPLHGVLIGSVAMLALFEPTKSPLYGLVLVAPLTIVVSVAAARLLAGSSRGVRLWILLPIVVVALEGAIATIRDVRATRASTPYGEVAGRLADALADGAATGPQRWWWSLRSKGYIPVSTLSLRWQAGLSDTGRSFADVWRAAGIRYVVWSGEQEADQSRWPSEVRDFLERVRACGTSRLRMGDGTYGALEVIAVPEACSGG